MSIHIKRNTSSPGITINSITNSLTGSLGEDPQIISGGNTDEGYFTTNIPWNVNLNGTLYNNVYVSSNSFISFGGPSISGEPTTPETNKILLGTPKNTSVPDAYVKNFYSIVSGISGSRELRMRFEGEFKTDPINITSTEISNNLLGRQSLQQYSLSSTFPTVELSLPWNVNFNVKNGEVQNGVKIFTTSYIQFGKREAINANFVFTNNENILYVGGNSPSAIATGLWAGIEGTAPNRTYRIRYEGYDDFKPGKPPTAWEVIFYENDKNIVDVQTALVPDFFSLDLNGWYDQFNSTLVADLTNTSGNYANRGTRFSQSYDQSSLEWESTFYENDQNRIDVQFGNFIGVNVALDYYYGVYSKDSLLGAFSTPSNAGYSIISNSSTSAWSQIQNVFVKTTPLALPSAWQYVKNIFVRDANIWRLVHGGPPVYFFCKRSTYENDVYGNRGGSGIAAFQNDTFIVPSGVTEITVELWGGGGSGGSGCANARGGNGGGGGYVKATLSVTPGETLIVRVGGGAWHYAANAIQHPSVSNIGGIINVVSRRSDVSIGDQTVVGAIAGSGGGYSAIFRGSTPLVVAGGGGGGGSASYDGLFSICGAGGAGGGSTGQSGRGGASKVVVGVGRLSTGGQGGSQSSGGTGGLSGINPRGVCAFAPSGENGSYLQGGRGVNSPTGQSTNIVQYGTASNPGTNGGAAGGGGSKTGATVCYDGNGIFQGSPIDQTAYNSTPVVFTWGGGNPLSYYDNYSLTSGTVYSTNHAGGGGGGGYYGGGGGGTGYTAFLINVPQSPPPLLDSHSCGGSGGGGGSNYDGGANLVISNNQGNLRVPGDTTSPYYLNSYLYPPTGGVSGVPFNAFAQGGVGYGGVGGSGSSINNIAYGTRGENGLIVIYW